LANTYLQEYRQKLITAEQAASLVNSNDRILYAVFADGRQILILL
jgi:3-oxoacyl-[acyl-carrier-protein] synthase III